MKHYIVTYEDRLWLSYAHNPKEAIFNVIAEGVDGDWHDFTARSVGSYTVRQLNLRWLDADE